MFSLKRWRKFCYLPLLAESFRDAFHSVFTTAFSRGVEEGTGRRGKKLFHELLPSTLFRTQFSVYSMLMQQRSVPKISGLGCV